MKKLDPSTIAAAVSALRASHNFSVVDGRTLIMLPEKIDIPTVLMQDELFIVEFEKLKDATKQAAPVVRVFAEAWRRNIEETLRLGILFDGAPSSSLIGKAKKKPGILVSAGPSLDQNVTQLRAAKGKSIIVCVDTALKTLIGHGIEPDFVVSICAAPDNLRDFDGLIMPPSCGLIYLPLIDPRIPAMFERRFPVSNGHPFIEWIRRAVGVNLGIVDGGGSVALAGFQSLQGMGCDPIILVGQDLAYTRGRSHTEGSPLAHDEAGTLEVYALDGTRIRSSENFVQWREWFEHEIKIAEATVINATAEGAKIKGAIRMRLDSAVKAFCRFTVPVPTGERFAEGLTEKATDALDHATPEDAAVIHFWELGAFGRNYATQLVDTFNERRRKAA